MLCQHRTLPRPRAEARYGHDLVPRRTGGARRTFEQGRTSDLGVVHVLYYVGSTEGPLEYIVAERKRLQSDSHWQRSE